MSKLVPHILPRRQAALHGSVGRLQATRFLVHIGLKGEWKDPGMNCQGAGRFVTLV